MKTKLVDVSLLRQPSAWLPPGMSLAALTLVPGHAAIFGIVHEQMKVLPLIFANSLAGQLRIAVLHA